MTTTRSWVDRAVGAAIIAGAFSLYIFFETGVRNRLDRIENRLGDVEQRIAKIEGYFNLTANEIQEGQ